VHRIFSFAALLATGVTALSARRWKLTVNHWDLPVHRIDPHAAQD
jgi:hypothetical protein